MYDNPTSLVNRNLGRLEITQSVRNSIKDFVLYCLNSEYDVIVPIQEEGLAIFLPQLRERKQNNPEIIPSNSLAHIDKEKLKGKSVLIVEAAIRTGGEIYEITDYIEKNFPIKSTSIAAFIVLDGFKHTQDLENPIFHILSPNQYLWAKEVIVEYLLDEVFVHFADPPMWEFNIPGELRQETIDALLHSDYSYVVPELNKDDDWIRITVNDIKLIDRSWLVPEIELQPTHKVRILLHKRKELLRVLPLFYPKILASSKSLVSDVLNFATKTSVFELDSFNEVLKLSLEVKYSPYNTFRWVSTLGSILLLRDMQFLFPELKLNFNEMKLSAPIPNLYQYSCSDAILDAFQSLARELMKLPLTGEQFLLPKSFFGFSENNTSDMKIEYHEEERAPEEILIHEFSKWINKLYAENPPDLNEILNRGLPLEDIYKHIPNSSYFGFNQALDRLIDEGLIKPRLGRDSNNYIVRTFAPGGESIRIQLRSLGRVIDLISQG